MLNCGQFLDELCDYLDGTADERHFAESERHLAQCRKCRIVCDTTRQTIAIYRHTWSAFTLPADVEQRLMAFLAEHYAK